MRQSCLKNAHHLKLRRTLNPLPKFQVEILVHKTQTNRFYKKTISSNNRL